MTENENEKELAAIGPQDFVLGFQLAGIKRVVETTPETYPEAIEELLDKQAIGIIITRAQDVTDLPPQLEEKVTDSVDPVVIQLGGQAGAGLREKIRSAIGIDLLRE